MLFPFFRDLNSPDFQAPRDGVGEVYSSYTDSVRTKPREVKYNKITATGFSDYRRNRQDDNAARYTNASELNVIGKIANKGKIYHRLDTAEFSLIPENVKVIAAQSEGLPLASEPTVHG